MNGKKAAAETKTHRRLRIISGDFAGQRALPEPGSLCVIYQRTGHFAWYPNSPMGTEKKLTTEMRIAEILYAKYKHD
jgi:hypothetical protein